MRNNEEFKINARKFGQTRFFTICHFLTAQYMSDCQQILLNTELLNLVLIFFMTKGDK